MRMVSFTSVALAALSSLIVPSLAIGNLNLYWGQYGTRSLAEACAPDGVEYITLAFVYESPENDGTTGYPGIEFAGHCSGVTYSVNGQASNLLKDCTTIQEGIPVCQAQGTKILLSIGGVFNSVTANYNVSTVENGRYFADFLWGAFGPYNASFDGPRPFDISSTEHNSVDGFDFDIEEVFPSEAPWVAMIDQLRGYWDANSSYIITGAPQCPVTDATLPMRDMIAEAQFDILWIQFYNNPECDGTTDAFSFDAWVEFLSGTRSAHATLYIGLPAEAGSSGYLNYSTLSSILNTYATRPAFGGVMLWDSYLSMENMNATSKNESYAQVVKQILATITPTPTPTTTAVSSPSPTSCTYPYIVKAGDDCYNIALEYNISVSQILTQNPELDSFCDITVGELLCLPPACTETYTVESGNTCSVIDSMFNITYAQLEEYNPGEFNADCTNLNVGQVLCVAVGAPSTNGTASTTTTMTTSFSSTSTTSSTTSTATPSCGEYYTVESGDTCYEIDELFGITFAELQYLNPGAFNTDCTNLQLGQVLCVAAVASNTTSTTTTTSVSSTSTASSATSTATSPPCGEYYTVESGNTCYEIEEQFGIDFAELEYLNPGAFNTECTNLQVEQVLCVEPLGATSTTVSATITANSTTSLSSSTSSQSYSSNSTSSLSASSSSTSSLSASSSSWTTSWINSTAISSGTTSGTPSSGTTNSSGGGKPTGTAPCRPKSQA